MKKLILYLLPLLYLGAFSCGGNDQKQQKSPSASSNKIQEPINPEHNAYRVEMTGYDTSLFHDHYAARIEPPTVNLNQPLDNKSVSELYLLKNSLLAMKGQNFDDAILIDYFSKLPWYQPPYWEENFKVNLNDAEQKFIAKIDTILSVLNQNNRNSNGIPSTNYSLNHFQYSQLAPELFSAIDQNGFIILNEKHNQPTNIYQQSKKECLPNFVTTDLILNQMHQFYGLLENEIEVKYLTDILKSMLEIINVELYSSYEKTLEPNIEKAVEESLLYYAIPYAILTGNKTNLIGNYNQIYFDELKKVLDGEGIGSKVINNDQFNYQVFKPHGHYSENPQIEKYYKALTWLQKISLCLNNKEEFSRAILIAYIINKSDDLRNSYQEYVELKTYFSSQKDQFTFWDLADVVGQIEGIKVFEDLFKEETIQNLRDRLQIQEQEDCQVRISLMPKEYQNLYTDLDQIIKNNETPSPVQLFAALGNPAAKRLITQQDNTEAIMENLLGISTQEEARSIDWLSTLLTSFNTSTGMPASMKNDSWQKKELNAALASWLQLDERVHIQAKRKKESSESEENMKGKLKGYVEPNITFWKSATTILTNTQTYLSEQHMLSKSSAKNINDLLELISFLQTVSEKEISGVQLSDEDYVRISNVGNECQNLTFNNLSNGYDAKTHKISSDMTFATMVHDGNNNKVAGLGKAHSILVPVDIDGYIYLTKGAVFSYYEVENYSQTHINQQNWTSLFNSDSAPELLPWFAPYYQNNISSSGPVARN